MAWEYTARITKAWAGRGRGGRRGGEGGGRAGSGSTTGCRAPRRSRGHSSLLSLLYKRVETNSEYLKNLFHQGNDLSCRKNNFRLNY